MNKITLSLILLSVSILACSNTATIANTPAPKAGPIATQARQMVVIAEIGLQVRSACGIDNPTTGVILTHGETVTTTGAAVVLPDMSRWQPIIGGCVNADYLK
jgi:hypothetical protein